MTKTLTDILLFDKSKGERVKHKDCEILTRFLLKKNDLYLVRKNGLIFACIQKDGDLISLWHCKEFENGEIKKTMDALMLFRKKFLDNDITQERLELFINSPLDYEKKYPKKLK